MGWLIALTGKYWHLQVILQYEGRGNPGPLLPIPRHPANRCHSDCREEGSEPCAFPCSGDKKVFTAPVPLKGWWQGALSAKWRQYFSGVLSLDICCIAWKFWLELSWALHCSRELIYNTKPANTPLTRDLLAALWTIEARDTHHQPTSRNSYSYRQQSHGGAKLDTGLPSHTDVRTHDVLMNFTPALSLLSSHQTWCHTSGVAETNEGKVSRALVSVSTSLVRCSRHVWDALFFI